MRQSRIRAVYMRGGTSRALFFHDSDLSEDPATRDRILLSALGSPDPYGRQLDGLGGGISSLSKAVIVGPSTTPEADLDYTFAQVSVGEPLVDYTGNCGNCTAAVGPFAIDEGLVGAEEPEATVRLYNTNTKKLIVARVPVAAGEAAVMGDFELPGVAGGGARIALDFLDPGGAVTGALLPSGQPRQVLEVPSVGEVEASLIDATNPIVFVRAQDLGCAGTEPPDAVDSNAALLVRLEAIRTTAAGLMGLAPSPALPKVAMVAVPAPFRALDGRPVKAEQVDVAARVMSMGTCHRAFALTAAMCLAVAARIEGTVVHQALGTPARRAQLPSDLRLGHPSGILPINATVVRNGEAWEARRVTVYRTARRLMEGWVRVPSLQ
ncbi:MAG: 2-methylaconitate cis-trans isomerase PrpF family protein [Candidatus Methylomirabilia bacterium]